MDEFTKDPDAVLDYAVDWSDWLEDGESISSYTVSVPSGLTKDSDAIQGGDTVVVWLSGGEEHRSYRVTVHITTDNSPINREDDRSFLVKVRPR